VSCRLSPRTVARADQILATLADEGSLPISTPELWRKISPYRPRSGGLAAIAAGDRTPRELSYSDTWRVLARLARLGEVEKITVPEMRACYWRRWPEAQPGAGLPELEAGQ
jgi:hypothetical protein